jgi:pimeloyl-ACP methyl ester carboxylesterase
MKNLFIFVNVVLFAACAPLNYRAPENYVFSDIQTQIFKIAVWQKNSNLKAPLRVYIEGDGDAFNYRGAPTSNPTPSNKLVRSLAFNDPAPNVAYIARPCQFVKDKNCSKKYWTSARFSKEVVDSMTDTIKQISNGGEIILIGYSGGAQIAQMLNLKPLKIITIAGVLNHEEWTKFFNDEPLKDSLPAPKLKKVPQVHFVGGKDKIVPPELFDISKRIIPNATHTKGWLKVSSQIYEQ